MDLEWLTMLGFLGLLAVLVLASARRARVWMWLLFTAGLVGVGYGGKALQARRLEAEKSRAQLASKLPGAAAAEAFVTSDQCRSCHPNEYHSWHASYHRTMTQVAGTDTVLGDFNNVNLDLDGERFRLERRGSEYWVEMVDPDWKHDQAKARAGIAGFKLRDPKSAPRVWKRVGLLTGSHHFQAYWVPSMFGNLQFAFPFAWLIDERRWVPRKDTFIRDPSLGSPLQIWNINCIQCHATMGQPRHDPKTLLMDTRATELGISCESCHGPGERHLAAHQDPRQRYRAHGSEGRDEWIVNPKRLAAKAATEACGQCHGMKWIRDREDWIRNGFRYRPGDDLEATIPLVRPVKFAQSPWLPEALKHDPKFLEGAFWPDGMIRVTGREYNGLIESACHTKGTLSCLSCHSMHQSDPADQLAARMDGNQACLQCHERFASDFQAHTRHAPGSSGSLCYNCHMPHGTYGLLKSVRNHYIDSPSARTTLETGRPNACNLCHLDRSLGWTAKHLSEWYQAPPVVLPAEHETTSYAALTLLRGNAGERALFAAGAGWTAALQASGERWLVPLLADLLEDPYSALRYMGAKSLRAQPEFKTFQYDYLSPAETRARARERALQIWSKSPPDRTGQAVLLNADGSRQQTAVDGFRSQRDDRVMDLIE
jgi:predicted CXXCH cytochrome family protein